MESKKSYGKGILGGLVFGMIASIPWILIYTLANYFIAYLGALIGIGVVFGYKNFSGKLDKKMPIFVSIIILFILSINMFIIIPGLMLIKSGIPFSLDNLILLYQIEGMTSAIMGDYFMSILFAALGSGSLIYNTYLQIKNNQADVSITTSTYKLIYGYMIDIKNYFINNNSTDKDHPVVFNEKDFDKTAFLILKNGGALVEVDGLYYYDLEKGKSVEENYLKSNKNYNKFSKYVIIFFIISILILVISSLF